MRRTAGRVVTSCPACGQSLALGVRSCLARGADITGPPRPQTLPSLERVPRWRLTKLDHVVEAFARTTPWGPELVESVDGKLPWSHVYRGVDPVRFAAAVEAKQAEFEGMGWQR